MSRGLIRIRRLTKQAILKMYDFEVPTVSDITEDTKVIRRCLTDKPNRVYYASTLPVGKRTQPTAKVHR